MIRKETNMDNALNDNIENSDIIIRYLSHETTQAETHMVENWIAENDENRKHFESIKRIYENKLFPGEIKEFEPNLAWSKYESNYTASNSVISKNNNVRKMVTVAIKIAAVLFIAVSLAGIYYWVSNKNVTISSSASVKTYTMPDGSTISLNKNSTVHYSNQFGKKQRELELTGEAFFAVKRDPSKPFVIHINKLEIEVLGTRFNVNAYPHGEKTEVVVQSGVVKVSGAADTIILKQGEKAEFTEGSNRFAKLKNTNPNYNSWETHTYIFEMTSMSDVIETLEKDFNVTINLSNQEFNSCKLYAHFQNKSLTDMLTIIKHTFNIDYVVTGNKILIKGKGC
jgi:transmembrane sensor